MLSNLDKQQASCRSCPLAAKQAVAEPIHVKRSTGYATWRCPVCRNNTDPLDIYCRMCGQKLREVVIKNG